MSLLPRALHPTSLYCSWLLSFSKVPINVTYLQSPVHSSKYNKLSLGLVSALPVSPPSLTPSHSVLWYLQPPLPSAKPPETQRAAEGDHECPVSIPCKPYCATWTIPIHLALLFFLSFLPKKTDPKFNICNPWSVCVYTEVRSVSHPATLAWKLLPKLHVT